MNQQTKSLQKNNPWCHEYGFYKEHDARARTSLLDQIRRAIEKHETCKLHERCVSVEKSRTADALSVSAEQGAIADENKIRERSPATMKMFDLVYTEAYIYYPFSSHETLLQTIKRLTSTIFLNND